VRFFSPIKAVEGKEKLVGNFTTERLHSRRMQCTYSWDWVERFVTCGIYSFWLGIKMKQWVTKHTHMV